MSFILQTSTNGLSTEELAEHLRTVASLIEVGEEAAYYDLGITVGPTLRVFPA